MLDMLRQTGRPEMVVGWYHSHPGFGCWLSGVDINTQQSFEALSDRAVAVVVDPIQSVKGKVVIDAFRLINPNMMVLGQEPRYWTERIIITNCKYCPRTFVSIHLSHNISGENRCFGGIKMVSSTIYMVSVSWLYLFTMQMKACSWLI